MPALDPLGFSKLIIRTCQKFPFVTTVSVVIEDGIILKMRVYLEDETFIAIFYNSTTEKTSFALIKENARLFGANNSYTGWHLHPFDSPEMHIASTALTFEQFLEMVARERFPFGKDLTLP
ncbi:MAG: hypothetical protein AB1393_06475 [Candidatus Edwardsbacteria bacterium]